VEALRRHSNRADLVKIMVDVLRCIEGGDKTNEPGVESTGNGLVLARPRELRSEDDIMGMIAGFQDRVGVRELAARYVVSESTVKRILKRHGVSRSSRKARPGSAAAGD
jgi:hypothetical protein